MRKNLFSHFSLIKRLKKSKNVLSGIVVSMSVFSSPQLFGQCVAPVVPPTTICSGNLAQLSPTNANPSGTLYDWYSASTGGTPLYTGNIYTPQLSSNTTFYVASRGTGCPTTRTSVTVTVNPAPDNTVSLPTTACVGEDVNITFSPNTNLVGWLSTQGLTPRSPSGTGGQNYSIYFFTAVSSGTLTYEFQTPAGCTKTVSSYLTVYPALATPTMTSVTSVCQGVSLPLAPSMAGGTWTISPATGATISGNTFTGTTAGVYAVTYTVSNAGCSKYVTSNITVNPLPVGSLTLDKPIACAGDIVTAHVNYGTNTQVLTVPAGVTTTNGAGWSGGYATWSAVSQSGTYVLTLTTAASCSTTISAALTVNPLPVSTISVAKTTICKDETLQLVGSNSGGTGVWSISTNPLPALTGGATQNSTISATGLFTGSNPGIYNTRYTVTQTLNGLSCSAFSEKQITVGALPFTITGPSSICQSGSGNYAVQQIQAGGSGNNTYAWNVYQAGTVTPPVPATYAALSGFNLTLATLIGNGESPKTLTLTAEGKFYCTPDQLTFKTASASINVTVVAAPSGVRLKCADAICNTLTAVMKDGSSTAGLTFSWYNASIGTSSVLGTTTTITNPKLTSSWGLGCTVTNSTGCSNTFYWYAYPNTDACGRATSYDYTKPQYCEQAYIPCTNGTQPNLRKENSDNSTYQFNVYPNPATNKISFVSDGTMGSAVIYDMDGITLKTLTLTEGRTMYDMDITEIPSGVYFLHVTSSSGQVNAAPVVKE